MAKKENWKKVKPKVKKFRDYASEVTPETTVDEIVGLIKQCIEDKQAAQKVDQTFAKLDDGRVYDENDDEIPESLGGLESEEDDDNEISESLGGLESEEDDDNEISESLGGLKS